MSTLRLKLGERIDQNQTVGVLNTYVYLPQVRRTKTVIQLTPWQKRHEKRKIQASTKKGQEKEDFIAYHICSNPLRLITHKREVRRERATKEKKETSTLCMQSIKVYESEK
jgi:hypothetical protein